MGAPRPARPVCEAPRAYRELLHRPAADAAGPTTECSPEPPEVRDYPAPKGDGARFVLCNGHLRDLFAEQDRERARPPLP